MLMPDKIMRTKKCSIRLNTEATIRMSTLRYISYLLCRIALRHVKTL